MNRARNLPGLSRCFPTFARWLRFSPSETSVHSSWRTSPWWKRETVASQQRTLLHVLHAAVAERCNPVPLIEGLAEEHRYGYRRKLRRLAKRLREGSTLSVAVEQTPGVLSDDAALAIRFGGHLGMLSTVLEALVVQRDLEVREFWRRLGKVELYATALLAATGLITLYFAAKIAPTLQQIYADFRLETPMAFRALTNVISIVGSLPGLIGVALAMVALSRRGRRLARRLLWDRVIPLVPRLRTASLFQLLGLAAEEGRPLTAAVATLARYHFDPAIRHKLLVARNDVELGTDLFQSMADASLIAPTEADALRLASSNDRCGWALQALAESRRRRAVQLASSRLEWAHPLLALAFAIPTFLVALSVMTSLIRLVETLS